MKTPNKLLLLVLTALLSLAACNGSNDRRGTHWLIVVNGEVQLKRNGWQGYHPTTFGAILQQGDLLKPAEGAEVIVLCDDLTATRRAPAGEPSGLDCPSSTKTVERAEGNLASPRGDNDKSIPFVISPRDTRLLTDAPILRWNPVPGVERYTVEVRGEEVQWETETGNSSVLYEGPALKPDQWYSVIVTADNGTKSTDENAVGLGFSVLSEEAARPVQEAAAKLDKLPSLSDDARQFVLAQIYAEHGLIAEAIEQLEMIVNDGSSAPNVYRTLGDLYWRVGLFVIAGERYTTAAQLAKDAGDEEALAAAQAGLGKTYARLGKSADAIKELEQAQAGYEKLGEATRAAELVGLIVTLTPPTPAP